MVTLPDADSVGPLPDRLPKRMGVGSWSPDIISKDAGQLGSGLESAGQGLGLYAGQQQRQDNALAEAKANASWLTSKVNLDNDVQNQTDPDQLSAHPQMYSDALNTASQFLPEGPARDKFVLGNQPQLASAVNGVGNRVFSLNKDSYLANTTQQLSDLRNAGLKATSDQDKENVIRAGGALFDQSVAKGYMTALQAQQAKTAWGQNYAISSIQALPAQQQLAALSPVNTGAAAKQAFDFFTSKGWTPEQASGIVGNLLHESGGKLDPNARAIGDGSDGSDSIGIGQWNQDRATALKAFAAQNHKPWNDYATQLAFVDNELNGSESDAGQALKDAQSPSAATAAFLQYERPHGYEGGPNAASGWSNRLRQANGVYAQFQNGSDPNAVAGSHLVPFIPEDQRIAMAETASRNVDSMARQEQANVKSLINDDQSSIVSTGQPIPNLTPERVAAAMGPEQAEAFRTNRAFAANFYNQTNDFDTIPESTISDRLDRLKPIPGTPGFDQAQTYYEAAQKKAQTLINARYADPAGSVDQLPGVANARRGVQPNDPSSFMPVIKARLIAQDALGIPEGAQSPITDQEAKRYASVLRPVSKGQAETQDQGNVINAVVDDVNQRYGPYAQQAMARVLYHVTMKTDAANILAAAMQKYKDGSQQGPLITPDQLKQIQMEQDAKRAAQIAGVTPLPAQGPIDVSANPGGLDASQVAPATAAPGNQKPFWQAVDMLRADPRLLPQFIQRFGTQSVPNDLKDQIPAISGGPKPNGQ